jgi:hypothetical protein
VLSSLAAPSFLAALSAFSSLVSFALALPFFLLPFFAFPLPPLIALSRTSALITY